MRIKEKIIAITVAVTMLLLLFYVIPKAVFDNAKQKRELHKALFNEVIKWKRENTIIIPSDKDKESGTYTEYT